MKKPKLNKPKLPKAVKIRRRKAPEERVSEALQNVPRITNETVAEHREEVLSSARKFIYPLQHSKHRVVRISIIIIVTAIIAFFVFTTAAIYKFQSTSGFIYGVSKVIPFPVAKVGSSWVSYESYLFDLRRYMHYYQTQQNVNFKDKIGKTQLDALRKSSMQTVINDAAVKQLASKYHVSVSDQQVDEQVQISRQQNRLGSNDRVFRDVLNKYWGWSESDFRRQLKQQMLAQAVVAKLDTNTNNRAQLAYVQLQNGADFAAVAAASSDDAANKASGGAYGVAITPNYAGLSPIVTNELFKMAPGETSKIINTGYSLEILKVLDKTDNTLHAAHIQFIYKPITSYTDPIIAKNKPNHFISVPK
jgi:parvulin-like peptidyl-prolyl isomerase